MKLSTEPAITIGTITALVAALIVVATAFGLPLSDPQTQSLLGLTAVVGPLVAALLTRGRVYSPATHDRTEDEAWREGYDEASEERREN